MRTCIVGLGLIGGSLALDLRTRGFAKSLLGVDVNPVNATKARELKLVESVETLADGLRDSELVILAMPVNAIEKLLPDVLDKVSSTCTVTDMGSTKQAICSAVARHPRRAQFVASHPMAGTENSGPTAAVAELFDGKTAVICNREQSGDAHLQRIEALYACLHMRIVNMSDAEHDLHAAYVSHLSHISSFVLANTVLDKERVESTIFDLAGGGFESTVRLAKSSPDMWAPIFSQNRQHVLDALQTYIAQLQLFHQSLVDGDQHRLRALMQNANQIREVLREMHSEADA